MRLFTIVISVVAAIASFSSCSGLKDTSPLLEELDRTLEKKDTYIHQFNDRMMVLKEVLAEQTSPEQKYSIRKRISEGYRTASFDSSMYYLNLNLRYAEAVKDTGKIMETNLMMADIYVMAGYYTEADELVNNYSDNDIPDALKLLWYRIRHVFYGEMQAYTCTRFLEEMIGQRDRYRNLLLDMVEPDTYEWYDLKREEADISGDMELVQEYALKMIHCVPENSNAYARAAFFYAISFPDGSEPLREEWLVKSAIADVVCATKDYASLNTLSSLLFSKGDVERAFRYAADHCMVDALLYNGKLRPLQISQFFPQIEKAYQDRNKRQTRILVVMIMIVSALLVVLLLMFIFILKRQQVLDSMRMKLQESYLQIDDRNHELEAINNRLVVLNVRMQETDKVKQEYIALFLGMVSENISTTRQYKNHVLKSIRQGKAQALIDEIDMLPSLDDDIMDFYKMFDEAFVNLYPDFVDKFNALLVDGAAIIPKGDDILTPELRIFALIKLGNTDSSKIASLLHYSANTIYNYRSKTKNKARGSREGFEDAVRNIE